MNYRQMSTIREIIIAKTSILLYYEYLVFLNSLLWLFVNANISDKRRGEIGCQSFVNEHLLLSLEEKKIKIRIVTSLPEVK